MLLALRAPPLNHVDDSIFSLRYPGACMQVHSCHDWCCQFGCDADVAERDLILSHQEEIARFARAPVARWFDPEVELDPDSVSGRCVRTNEVDGACVFRQREGRGCGIHAWAAGAGVDYHSIKPRVCWLFPLHVDAGVLRPSPELTDDLVCRGMGVTVYAAARDELRHAFGAAVVAELDRAELAARARHRRAGADPRPAP